MWITALLPVRQLIWQTHFSPLCHALLYSYLADTCGYFSRLTSLYQRLVPNKAYLQACTANGSQVRNGSNVAHKMDYF